MANFDVGHRWSNAFRLMNYKKENTVLQKPRWTFHYHLLRPLIVTKKKYTIVFVIIWSVLVGFQDVQFQV